MALSSWTQQQILDQLNSGSKWSGSTITYAFPTASSGLYGSQEASGFQALNSLQQSFAELALQTWDDLIVPDLQRTTSSSNIEFGTSTTGVSYAHAYFPTVGSIWFNRAYADLMTPQIGKHSFVSYVHEIGHAFGLDHMGNYNGSGSWSPSNFYDSGVYSVMSYFGPNWGSGQSKGEGLVAWADWVGTNGQLYSPQTPMLNDIMAIQSMYGIETTTRSNDSIYGFGSNITDKLSVIYDFSVNLNPIITIYDSNGIDTLSLSGWSTANTINLMPGSYSSGNNMTYNIAIAYTSDIENATGGSGTDTITGNLLGNRLDGGAGNDVISGGNGDDTLIAGAGNDTLDGGDGVDSIVFSAAWSNYSFTSSGNQEFSFINNLTGSDTIRNFENFIFSDVTKSLNELLGTPTSSVPAVSISANSTSVVEGQSGSTTYTFAISLNMASETVQTVDWNVSGSGSSPANAEDLLAASGTATFQPGQTTHSLQIQIVGDSIFESDESFTVTLANPSSGLILGANTATGVILNDDVLPNVDDYPLATSTSGVLAVNGTELSGAIEKASDGDLFKVSLVAGTTYVFDLNKTGGNLNPYLELFNPSLLGVAFNDNASSGTTNSQIIYTAPTTGTYYLAAWDYSSATGTYSIKATTFKGQILNGDSSANTLVGTVGDDSLFGLEGNDTLNGGAGADLLDGGLGLDALTGGNGDDTYVIDNLLDKVTESATTGGSDVVQSSVNYTLGNNLEKLVLTETAPLRGTGNTLANTLIGNAGDNLLNGKAGADNMDGGEGSDIYQIDLGKDHPAAEIFDKGNSGIDEIRFAATAAGTLDLFAGDIGIERVVIGSGTNSNATTSGTVALNINASAMINSLTIIGNSGNNNLTGTAFDDAIDGGAGNDIVIGGNGADMLTGGIGNDFYIINRSSEHAAAEIVDSSGSDELRFASTIAGETLTVYEGDVGLERIVIGTGSGAAAISTAIVALNIDASSAPNGLTFAGNAGNNTLLGTPFIDNILGGAGNDAIEGGAGNDTLNGGIGIDSLTGGIGDDLYIIDNVSDQIIENANLVINGNDSIQTSVNYLMPENVENLTLTGTTAISGTGNAEANLLSGNNAVNTLMGEGGNDNLLGLSGNDILNGGEGNDVLIGGAGNDELTGGDGADTFWFNTAPNAASNKDVIVDFISGIDKLQFSKSILSAVGITGQLTSTDVRFWASDTGVAHDLDDRLIYNTTTGALIYDNNGNKAGGAVVLETLGVTTHPELVASDIWIV